MLKSCQAIKRHLLILLGLLLTLPAFGLSSPAQLPDTYTEYLNQSNALYDQCKYAKANDFALKCLEIAEATYGTQHSSLIEPLLLIAHNYQILGDYPQAIQYATRALNTAEAILGANSPEYARSLNDLALYQAYAGHYQEALTLGTQALDLRQQLLGTQHPDYAISLSNLAWYTYLVGDWRAALKLGSQALERIEYSIGKESPEYAKALDRSVTFTILVNANYSEAIVMAHQALDICERVLGEHHPDYASSLYFLAVCNLYLGKYSESIHLLKRALKLQESIHGKNHMDYAGSLLYLASCMSYTGKYAEALKYARQSEDIMKTMPKMVNIWYGTLLSVIAHINYNQGYYDNAIHIEEKALEAYERLYGKKHPLYAQGLHDLAWFTAKTGEYKKSKKLATEALNIWNETLGKDHPYCSYALCNLAQYYNYSAEYEEAYRHIKEAIRICEKTIGKNHPHYQPLLGTLSLIYYHLGNFTEAIKVGAESLNLCKIIYGTKHPIYAKSLNNFAFLLSNSENPVDAIRYGEEALDIIAQSVGKNHPAYSTSLKTLATAHSVLGNYAESKRIVSEALDIDGNIYGKDHIYYATLLSELALYNSYLGSYQEALSIGNQALVVYERVYGDKHIEYAKLLHNLAIFHSYLGNTEEAIHLSTRALKIFEKRVGKKHPIYANSLNTLAAYHSDLGNYKEAIRLSSAALIIQGKTLGKNHPDYATTLSNIGYYYLFNGDFTKATELTQSALKTQELALDNASPDYVVSLQNLSAIYFAANQKANCERTTSEANQATISLVKSNFANLTANERRDFWNKHKPWLEELMPLIAYTHPFAPIIAEACDATLMAKGILLSSERDFASLLAGSGDKEALNQFFELRNVKLQLDKAYEMAPDRRPQGMIDSLNRLATNLEVDLISRSKIYGDFTRNLAIGWKEVSNALGRRDVAIEFVTIPTEIRTLYAAYILRPGIEAPAMEVLFEDADLAAIPAADLYTTSSLSEMIWGRLDEHIKDADRIFFAPAGELYNIAIEALPHYAGDGLISDRHSMYRLSSTRQIAAVGGGAPAAQSAALFGGLNYNAGSDQPQVSTTTVPRGGVEYLPATLTEINGISQLLHKQSVPADIFTGDDGTEAAFKSLSGRGMRLIHIATHGYYWTDSEIRRSVSPAMMLMGARSSAPHHVEDKALNRSGIFLSGANNALSIGGVPDIDADNNGILTAKEVADMDLRSLDLVVLSACRTGLGKVTGDGVFGLQRGFKKAGANALLMSLWDVDDRATQMLMTRFYQELFAGHTKQEALLAARDHVRNYEEPAPDGQTIKPYEHPRYWAAFIILDALD